MEWWTDEKRLALSNVLFGVVAGFVLAWVLAARGLL